MEEMSSKTIVSVQVSDDTAQNIERLKDDNESAKSDAIRLALSTGLATLGYDTRGKGQTPAQRLVRHVAEALGYVGTTVVAVSFIASVEFFFVGMAILLAGLLVAVAERVLVPRFEPNLSNRLPKIEVSTNGR